MIKSNYNIVAVMSGTSLDGVDIIYASYHYSDSWNCKIHRSETVKYSSEWKLALSQLVNISKETLQEIDMIYSRYLAELILEFIKRNKIEHLDFIASHGHTALHRPGEGLTYQIGNQQLLADVLRSKVICDFRVQDVQLGGQGAPLVPIGDRLLFHAYDFCLNLGGFANVSFESNQGRMAYDICPVNIVLNYYVSKLDLDYDDEGKIASKGRIHENLLAELNNLEFYEQPAPKSLGLEWVKRYIFPLIERYNLSVEDILRTFIEHIALQISKTLVGENTKVLVTGGGAYNTFLKNRIEQLSKSKICIPNKEIIEFKEALIFGLLGVLKDRNETNCLKSVTGAQQDHSSGKILVPNS